MVISSGDRTGYLVNFKKLLEYNTGKMPFGGSDRYVLSLLSVSLSFSETHTHTSQVPDFVTRSHLEVDYFVYENFQWLKSNIS